MPNQNFVLEIRSEERLIPLNDRIQSIHIQHAVNTIPTATLSLKEASVDEEKDDPVFSAGMTLTIAAGKPGSALQILFKGILVQTRIRLGTQRETILELHCQAEPFRMNISPINQLYTESTYHEIVESLFNKYEIPVQIAPTDVQHEHILQHQCTDWDFVLYMMRQNHRVCIIRPEETLIQKPSLLPQAAIPLKIGDPLEDIDLQTVKTEPESMDAKESIEERQKIASARGVLHCNGTHEVQSGDTVFLSGIHKTFDGLYYTSGVTHEFKDKQWKTKLHLGLSFPEASETICSSPQALADCRQSIHGLQIGVVTELSNDPTGEFRIKVQLPLHMDGQESGYWARYSNLHAGKNRGTLFFPEIGDEVIVGFIDQNPQNPIILGALHSSAKPSPIPLQDHNPTKGFITRSGIQMLLDDESPKFTVQMPSGKLICLDDAQNSMEWKDNHGNSIRMDASGIHIKSAKDLLFQCRGKMKQEADDNIEIACSSRFLLKSASTLELSGGLILIN